MTQIFIPWEQWEMHGAPEFPAARLLTTVELHVTGPDGQEDRILCHAEAVAVVDQILSEDSEDGVKLMIAAHDEFQYILDEVSSVVGDSRPQTVRMGEHNYVVAITPFG